MTEWRYFFTTLQDRGDDSIVRLLGRSDQDGLDYNAQMLDGTGTWIPSHFLVAYHLNGTTDVDYVWTPEERAKQPIAEFFATGTVAGPGRAVKVAGR